MPDHARVYPCSLEGTRPTPCNANEMATRRVVLEVEMHLFQHVLQKNKKKSWNTWKCFFIFIFPFCRRRCTLTQALPWPTLRARFDLRRGGLASAS